MTDRVFTRLTLPLSAVSILLLGLAIGAAWYVHNLQEQSSVIVENHMASARAGYELELSIREIRRFFFRYLRYGNPKDYNELPTLQTRCEYWLAQVELLADTEEEHELVKMVDTGSRRFFKEWPKYENAHVPLAESDRITERIESRLAEEVYLPVDAYQKLNEAAVIESNQASQRMAGRLIAGLVGVGVSGAVGGILVGLLIASSIRRTIHRTEIKLRSTAEQLSRVAGEPAPKQTPPPNGGELDAAVQSVSASAAAVIERLDRSQRDALRAEQLAYVGQMAAGIAHEVRNPLMAIKILVQKAGERRGNQPFAPRDFEVLEDEIERVEQIVNQFLDFARPPRIDKHVLEAHPLLERVVNGLAARADLQRVEIICAPPIEPLFVDVDSGQFQQVVYNLLVNALDSLPAGGLIEIEVTQEMTGLDSEVLIHVRDNGHGLPEELGDRIFEPFISSKESGLGLGLSICKRIVEAHGGSIRAANGPRGGAIFTVRLPLVAEPALVAVS